MQKKERIIAHDYRNRRIGDFLKELNLTEGRGSGFPTVKNAMKNNESPEAIFETNEQNTYFLTVLPIREGVEKLLKKDVYLQI
ncbi:ATP-binding protein [Flavobacterium sp. ZS1P14]|uniref:ATP-binding protein n=1 Tax=Flavobacterium sp. ZS1P14 TaxID=3401729 RepID=UPI003AAF6315